MAQKEIICVGSPKFDELHPRGQELMLYPLTKLIRQFYENPENQKAFELWKKEKRRIARQNKQKRATISTDQSDMVTPATSDVLMNTCHH